jgi:hypothetical protein
MYSNVADWHDVFKSQLQDLAFDDYRVRLTTAHDYVRRQGYAHGFPNSHHADYGQGVVYGTFLIK